MQRVVVIESSRRSRDTPADWLPDTEFRIVATTSPDGPVRSTVEGARPEVVLIDLERDTSPVALLDDVRAACPDAPAVVLADEDHTDHVVPAVQHGARGLLLRRRPDAELVEALRTVARGEVVIDPLLAFPLSLFVTRDVRVTGPYGLTRREELVVAHLPHQLTNGQIGRSIGISPSTVRTHLRNAKRKLGVGDRVEAAGSAVELGLA